MNLFLFRAWAMKGFFEIRVLWFLLQIARLQIQSSIMNLHLFWNFKFFFWLFEEGYFYVSIFTFYINFCGCYKTSVSRLIISWNDFVKLLKILIWAIFFTNCSLHIFQKWLSYWQLSDSKSVPKSVFVTKITTYKIYVVWAFMSIIYSQWFLHK